MDDMFEAKRISPMLLREAQPFDDVDSIFELKLDGIRCIAYIDKQSVTLQNKRFKDVTQLYPELCNIKKCVKKRCILDGELVLIKEGKPDFFGLQRRSLMNDNIKIEFMSQKNPVQYVAYDILYLDKKDITDLPLIKRKEILGNNVKEGNNLSVSRFIEKDGIALFESVKKQGLEGIVAKKKNGRYLIGKRSSEWVKIKVMQDEDVFICGYQPDENGNVKDLVLGFYDGKKLKCRGKVYLGVSAEERRLIKEFAQHNTVKQPHFPQFKNTVWLKPELVGTVHFMHETQSGSLRQPVWKGLKE